MNDFCLVSVVMPVYNSSQTIRRAIESIINQTYVNWELLVILEKETDEDTLNIVREYEKSDHRVKAICKTGEKGVASSLNLGLSIAKGTYVARMDSDDYSFQYRLQKQVEYMEGRPDVAVCGSNCIIVTPNGESFLSLPLDYESIKAAILFQNCIVHPSVMMRKKVFDTNNWTYCESSKAEDYELWLRIINQCVITNIDEPLIKYFYDGIHNTSAPDRIKSDVYNTVNKAYTNLFKNYDLIIPEPLLGFDYPLEFWESNPNIINETIDFLENILIANIHNGYSECLIFEEEILRRWNSFLEQSFFFQKKYHNICNLLYLDTIKSHSIKKSISANFENYSDDLFDIINLELDDLRDMISGIDKVVVYGAGNCCLQFYDYLKKYVNVLAYVDSNKVGETFGDKLIKSPGVILDTEFDAVLIASIQFYDDIFDRLCNAYKIPPNLIFPIHVLRFINL